MKKIIRIAIAIIVLVNCGFSQYVSPADGILGTWLVQDGTAKIKIEKSNGKYSGRLVWFKALDDKNTKPLLDSNNPDQTLRNRPKLGLRLLENFVYDGDQVWTDGTIYDPREGKTYSCILTMKNNETVDVRGYIGISLFGRTQTWKRTQDINVK